MTADGTLLLDVYTATRHYLVPRGHLERLDQMTLGALPASDGRGRPLIVRELGPLLDPADPGRAGRHHALVVALRRRSVALLVERIESLTADVTVQPLGPLLTGRLAQPWIVGAAVVGATPVIVLDLRRIAADVALGAV